MPSFLRELQLITFLLLICDFSMSWITRFVSLKLCVGFSIFRFVSFLLKLIFFSAKCMDSLTLKCHNSFKIKIIQKSHTGLFPRSMIFKLQIELVKFSEICVNWSSPKPDLEKNFFNLENRIFENTSFSQ